MAAGFTRQTMATIQMSVLMVTLFIFAGAVKASTTLTFQDGVGGYTGTQDTTIIGGQNGDPNTNYGSSSTLELFEREVSLNDFGRTLIRFDLSSIAPGSVIGSATLTLTYHGYLTYAKSITNSLYVVNSSDVGWTESGATWNKANATTNWAGGAGLVSPTDYDDSDVVATADTPNSGALISGDDDGATMTFTLDADGIAAINDWINNPSDNAGFFIRQPSGPPNIGTNGFDIFYSADSSGDASLHPELTLITTPEPASLGLLLAGGVILLRRRR